MPREKVDPKLFKCFLLLPCNLRDGLNVGRFALNPGGTECSDTRAGLAVERVASKGALPELCVAEVCKSCPALAVELSRFGYQLSDVPESWVKHS